MKKNIFKITNHYDWMLSILGMLVFAILGYGYWKMHGAFNPEHMQTLSLSWRQLPYDTLRTTMRLLIGLVWSFIFAFVAGTWSAKSKHAARVILPFINFMESVPLVGFLSFSTAFFVMLAPHSVMGIEYAAIFGVFTGQAWNMALTLYQTLCIVPNDLLQAADAFGLNAWQRYWRIEVPYAIPGLLWNTMVSQSAAWFALVATEAIPFHAGTIYLPGVGSYIQLALQQANYIAVVEAIVALVLNIVILDQLVFRPAVRWSEKFKFERTKSRNQQSSWMHAWLQKASAWQAFSQACGRSYRLAKHYAVIGLCRMTKVFHYRTIILPKWVSHACLIVWYLFFSVVCVWASLWLLRYFPSFDIKTMSWWMFLTTVRVAAAMILSLIIFVPLGIWIGLRPKWARACQPVIQILAALPPNIFYPSLVLFLIMWHQSLGWWTIPLIMIGTQWYILFNVIAGVLTIPQGMHDLSANFNVKGWFYFRHVIVPAIFPYIVTGIISAAGGAWNADITAEIITWGKQTLTTPGLGAYISKTTDAGLNHQAALGCFLMCCLVGLCIMFVWTPLYRLAERKYRIR